MSKPEKMSDTANCAQVGKWMLDAAADSLAEARRVALDAHIRACARCREEFQDVQALLQRIGESVSATVAAEPSQQLFANIRRELNREKLLAPHWWQRRGWLTAASACAALIIFFFAARALHKSSQRVRTRTQTLVSALPTRKAAVAPPGTCPIESASSVAPRAVRHPQQRKVALALNGRKSSRGFRRHAEPNLPEVIVQPGQMQAVMQFVAQEKKGKINGAEIKKGIEAAEKPLHIEPLQIAPLDSSATGENQAPASTGGSANSRSQ